MPPVSGPLGPRRRIATTLSNWRRESGQNLADVYDVTLISTSKLSRLENAEGKPRLRDVRDLIRHYGKEETPEASRLERWVKAAEVPGWWTDFSDDVLKNRLDTLLAYEEDAAVARVYTLPFVPALLQTDAYTEAVYRDMERRPEDQIGELLDIRRARKQALKQREGLEPLKLVAVTHECTLRQTVGSPEIMRDQLDELLVHSDKDNVSLYVFPFSAMPAFAMTCMWAYFEYQDPEDLEQDLVQFETPAGFWTIEDPDLVAGYRKDHDSLIDSSLNEDDSRALIRSIRDSMPASLRSRHIATFGQLAISPHRYINVILIRERLGADGVADTLEFLWAASPAATRKARSLPSQASINGRHISSGLSFGATQSSRRSNKARLRSYH